MHISIAAYVWLVLACMVLFSSNSHLECFKGKAWTKPHWPATVRMNLQSIERHLDAAYVRPNSGARFEFIPAGAAPATAYPTVRTPFKLVQGTLATDSIKTTERKSCTFCRGKERKARRQIGLYSSSNFLISCFLCQENARSQ